MLANRADGPKQRETRARRRRQSGAADGERRAGRRRTHRRHLALDLLLVGVGGLGSPLALALAAAGAGRLVLVDDDVVNLSNLQRQILYRTSDVGTAKTEAARRALERRGVEPARVETVRARFDASTAADLVARADVVCDASDSLATKFLVNDACAARRTPLRGGGRVPGEPARSCPCGRGSTPATAACSRLRRSASPPSRIDAGPFGAICGEVAALEARAAVALATGEDPTGVLGRLWLLEPSERRALELGCRPGCPACDARPASPSERVA